MTTIELITSGEAIVPITGNRMIDFPITTIKMATAEVSTIPIIGNIAIMIAEVQIKMTTIEIATTIEIDLVREVVADQKTEAEATQMIERIAIVDIVEKKAIEDATIAAEREAIVKDRLTAGPVETAETNSRATPATGPPTISPAIKPKVDAVIGNPRLYKI